MRSILVIALGLFILHIVLRASAQNQVPAPQPDAGSLESFGSMSMGLGSLPLLTPGQTRSISAENPTGGKGLATLEPLRPSDPYHLSSSEAAGWKKHPFLAPKAHETVTLMDVDGPGVIQHIWMVPDDSSFLYHGRSCILRFYWDDETSPSIEVPVTDFFAIGHDTFAPVNSLPVVVNPSSALNSFWPMPFRKHARITFTNDSDRDEGLLAYQITYTEGPVPANAAYFHAQYRQGSWANQNPYVIVDGLKGQGQYVGTVLEVSQTDDVWFGEGEVQFYIDGDSDFPTISGTGTEDYFLFSYGFRQVRSTPYSGLTLREGVRREDVGGTAGAKWTMYRWHIMDPIKFQEDLRITIEGLGGLKNQLERGFVKRRDLLSSVAYWYQTEPHAPFPPLPSSVERSGDPFADLPVSVFNLRQAVVTASKERFHWQNCGAADSDFRKLYSGYESAEGAFVCYGAADGVTSRDFRQERGFLVHPDERNAPISVTWPISTPTNSVIHLEYGLVPLSSGPVGFSVEAERPGGHTGTILQDTLRSPGSPRDISLRLPAGTKSLRILISKSTADKSSTIWFRPEVESPE
jgi:hypothetical protein